MIGKFLARTIAYDARMVEAVRRQGFILVDVMESGRGGGCGEVFVGARGWWGVRVPLSEGFLSPRRT